MTAAKLPNELLHSDSVLGGEETLLGRVIRGVGKVGSVLDFDCQPVIYTGGEGAGRRSSGERCVQLKTCPGPREQTSSVGHRST